MTNWQDILGWGSPIGLAAFFIGLGALLRGLRHGMKHKMDWEKWMKSK